MRFPAALLIAALALSVPGCRPCDDFEFDLADDCIPATMAADVELEIEVIEDCASPCSAPPACTAFVDHNRMVTVITSRAECLGECELGEDCRYEKTRCILPALPPDQYTVILPGRPPKQLTTVHGGVASCTL